VAEGDREERATGVHTGTPDVFISYASPDNAVANSIVENLEQHGLKCWLAPRNVKPGTVYAEAIVRAINQAKALVLVLSVNTMASAHVGREVERAASKRKQIVAFRVDATPLSEELEYFLSNSQWIDMPALGMPVALAKLAEAVGQGSAPVNPVATLAVNTASGTVRKRIAIVAAVVVGVGVAVAVGVHFWPSNQRSAQSAAVAPIADKSIAVLPFVDLSEKKDQEYFADGMSEEIMDLLAKISAIKVIGRTSSFQFKGKNEDLRTIGTQLGAAFVLEGSVRKAGDRVRITAQLIGTQDGVRRWSETYERDTVDVLKLQDEIAGGIARALEVTVGATDLQPRTVLPNPEAYDVYLHGRYAFDRSDQDGFAEAADDFQQAINLDSTFADAAAWLAITRMLQAQWGYVPPRTAFEQARHAADMALRLNSKLALAHTAIAEIHIYYDWDWAGAEKELDQALALQPRLALAVFVSSELAASLGHWDDAVRLMNDSLAIHPFYPSGQFVLGITRWRSGRLAEAEAAMRRGLQITPSYAYGHQWLAIVFVTRGQLDAALTEARLETDELGKASAFALVYSGMGRTGDANDALATVTIKAADCCAYLIGEIHSFRHETDLAFQWLDRAYTQKDSQLYAIKGDPFLRNLEGDPRYKAFLRKMNLPELPDTPASP
jgi:TolB-like protein/tetratricopeptide (TPR) repeat protein